MSADHSDRGSNGALGPFRFSARPGSGPPSTANTGTAHFPAGFSLAEYEYSWKPPGDERPAQSLTDTGYEKAADTEKVSSGFTGSVPVLRLSAGGRSKRHFFRWYPGQRSERRQPLQRTPPQSYSVPLTAKSIVSGTRTVRVFSGR